MKKVLLPCFILIFPMTTLSQSNKGRNIHFEGILAWIPNDSAIHTFSKLAIQIQLNNTNYKSKLDYFAGIQISNFKALTGYIKTSRNTGFSIKRPTPNLAISVNASLMTKGRKRKYKLTAALGAPILFNKGVQSFEYSDCIIHHSQKGKLYYELQNSLVLNPTKRFQQDISIGFSFLNVKEFYIIEYISSTRPFKVVTQNRDYPRASIGISFRYQLGKL